MSFTGLKPAFTNTKSNAEKSRKKLKPFL